MCPSSSDIGKPKKGGLRSRPGRANSRTLSPKQPEEKGVAQMIKHLPSKHEAQSLNPSTAKKKKARGWGKLTWEWT
jgi:hypothetical protein